MFFCLALRMGDANQKQRILLVDDEVAVRNFYQLYLEHHGFEVCPAASASEALQVLAGGSFEAVVVDIFLGPEDGLELVRAILAGNPRQGVVVISGAGYDEPAFEQALRTKAAGFYSKRLPLAQLLMEVKRVVRDRAGQAGEEKLCGGGGTG